MANDLLLYMQSQCLFFFCWAHTVAHFFQSYWIHELLQVVCWYYRVTCTEYDRLVLLLTKSQQFLCHHLVWLSCVTHILVDLNFIVIRPVSSCQLYKIKSSIHNKTVIGYKQTNLIIDFCWALTGISWSSCLLLKKLVYLVHVRQVHLAILMQLLLSSNHISYFIISYVYCNWK